MSDWNSMTIFALLVITLCLIVAGSVCAGYIVGFIFGSKRRRSL